MSTLFSQVRGNNKDKKSNKGFKNAFNYTIAYYATYRKDKSKEIKYYIYC